MTLQQNVLSKNSRVGLGIWDNVLTLQQNVLSKNASAPLKFRTLVLTLQQNVLSKNLALLLLLYPKRFDFTTKCSF